ncbi:MAG TPA: M23 family metallopeptidase [Terriglobia bacterium]|nr:M23 family metallopeptidase [Terriglobia bacterium]
MSKHRGKSESGVGAVVVFLLVVLAAIFILLGFKVASRQGPTILVPKTPKGLGQRVELVVNASDPKHNLKTLAVEVVQDGQVIHQSNLVISARPHRWWKFWTAGPVSTTSWRVLVGHEVIPTLKEGHATVRVTALNDSWGRFFRGGRSELALDLPVRFAPPQVEVLSTQHYINQGGCDMAVFKVSAGTTESGVQVGDNFFPSFPMKESEPQTRLCVFAYPYNLDPSTVPHIVARDDAGNESLASFNYKVFPKKFHSDTFDLEKMAGGKFLENVVPPIMSQVPELRDQGSLIKNFLLINGPLRQEDAQKLVAFSQHTAPRFLWKGLFIRLPGKTEASFADYRTYNYGGQVVDHQTHLGFDLAGSEHMPVRAANDGVIVFAGFLGIYGNAVVIDHGCGIQSLYGHMSSIAVKEGDQVKREKEIGRTGQTGLAGGDHLHFTMLLDGIPVNPVEWWDPHWIHDRIEAKLQPYAQ